MNSRAKQRYIRSTRAAPPATRSQDYSTSIKVRPSLTSLKRTGRNVDRFPDGPVRKQFAVERLARSLTRDRYRTNQRPKALPHFSLSGD